MSSWYDPKNFYAQTTTPGRFDYPQNPPRSSLPVRPYRRKTLNMLVFFCLIAWICAFIPGIVQNIGISALLGLLVSVLILDWEGFTTLNGRIRWKRMGKGKTWFLAFIFCLFSPFLLTFYIAKNAFKSYHEQKLRIPELPSARHRPKIGCATGIVVMLLTIPFTFVLAKENTNIARSQQAGTNITVESTPSQKDIVMTTPTPQPMLTSQPTLTPQLTLTPTPVLQPTHQPTSQPTPTPTPQQTVGVNGNPWGYDFNPGKLIYNPPDTFCDYFNCGNRFWSNTGGYIDECNDETYSQSGGLSSACSRHGGEMRPLYSH